MVFDRKNDKYLVDGDGENVYVTTVKSHYNAVDELGYTSVMTFRYGSNKYISDVRLTNDFEPVVNSRNIVVNSDNKLDSEYEMWYNNELDFYITGSMKDMEYADDDEPMMKGYFSIMSIMTNPLKDTTKIVDYLNDNIIVQLPSSGKINIIVQTQMGYMFKEHDIVPKSVNIDTMYNDDFKEIYEHIVDKLQTGGKGVILFHGEAGSGKTNLIKHLTTVVNKKFVFLPISMIGHISSPSFIGDLITNKGGVLVIEDCEQYIQDRKTSESSIVSPLLQITDGILSDILDIQVICTFNTDLTKVDEALRREGRLIAEYEFNELTDEKAEALAGGVVEGKKTLANIFNNLTFKGNKKEEVKIGFK